MTKTPLNRDEKILVRPLADGAKLEAEISPCVFMYPGYPLQLTVTMRGPGGEFWGNVFPVDRTKHSADYTEAAVERLLAGVRVKPCHRCSTPAFDPASVQTNRDGLCELCFLADLNAKWADDDESERQTLAARDGQMKQRGLKFRVTAWVHPDNGDDYLADWYFAARPTEAQIRRLLSDECSVVLDDFQVIAL